MNEGDVIDLLKNKISISISKRCSYDGDKLRIAILLDSEEIAYDYISLSELND